MAPLVSICIPVYNSENTIGETIDSALSQTYKNIEIIVVDNHSTDSTYEVVRSFQDKRIKAFQNKENIGMAGNWNRVLELATGEYIHFLCADDLLQPSCVEKKVKMIRKDSDIVMVTSATEIVSDDGKVLMERHLTHGDKIFNGEALAKKAIRFRNLYGEPSSIMVRADKMRQAGMFSENLKYTTDLEMWIRLSVPGLVGYVDDPLSNYRVSASNETSSLRIREILEDDIRMIGNIMDCTGMKINRLDQTCHKMMYIVRTIARNIFMRVKCHR